MNAKTRLGALGGLLGVSVCVLSATAFAGDKNWTAPKEKIYAQELSDDIMAHHPELLSVTFHGVPPGMSKVYTMFAGSYPERIGNADDPDDVDIIVKGITIVDPRWHRTKDTAKKFVMMMPMRDAAKENVGLLVVAFKNDTPPSDPEMKYYKDGLALRDALQPKITSYDALFKPAAK